SWWPSTGSKRPAASAWGACTSHCWPGGPPRHWSPWGAGARAGRAPGRAPAWALFEEPLLAWEATEALVPLGRWDQAEQVSRQGLETAPSDVGSATLALARAVLELGLGDLDRAEGRPQGGGGPVSAPVPGGA